MIRDPSDGSVKQKSAPPNLGSQNAAERNPPVMSDGGGAGTSGLSTSKLDAKEIARLEKSREWLRNRKNRGNEIG